MSQFSTEKGSSNFHRKWCVVNKELNFKDFSRPNKEIKYFSRNLTEFEDFSRLFKTFSRFYKPCHFHFMEGQTFYWSIYDRWWQHQMLVHAVSNERPRGRFLKSQGLSANPLPALLLASFFMQSLTLVLCSLLQNHKETLATQAKRRPMPSTTESRSTTLLIKQETGNVSFCGGRMTRERERGEKQSQQGREWRANVTFE